MHIYLVAVTVTVDDESRIVFVIDPRWVIADTAEKAKTAFIMEHYVDLAGYAVDELVFYVKEIW